MPDQSLLLQLVYLLKVQSMGRRRLAEAAGLTEMVVRQALDQLRRAGLVHAERAGLRLTEAAMADYRGLFEGIRSVSSVTLHLLGEPSPFLAGHLARTPTEQAWALRDAAVSRGATGLILLLHSGGEWCFAHNSEPLGAKNPLDAQAVAAAFPSAQTGDGLICVTAPDARSRGLSLWAAIAAVSKLAPLHG